MSKTQEAIRALSYIDPRKLDSKEWLQVIMACKAAGVPYSDVDSFNRKDPERYDEKENLARWNSIDPKGGISESTLFFFAKQNGYTPARKEVFSYPPARVSKEPAKEKEDSVLSSEELTRLLLNQQQQMNTLLGQLVQFQQELPALLKPSPDSVKEIPESRFSVLSKKEKAEEDDWDHLPLLDLRSPFGDSTSQLITYLETLFQPGELVSFCLEARVNKKGKWHPASKGSVLERDRFIDLLQQKREGWAYTHPQAGAWIRANPVDGNGVGNENMTRYAYVLVESDYMPVERQKAIYDYLNLPIAALLYSGKKSLHALVHIDAKNQQEYDERVGHLFRICEKHGLLIDKQNKNCSRLSRMPGVMRDGQMQSLLAVNTGPASYEEWKEQLALDELIRSGPFSFDVPALFFNEKKDPMDEHIIENFLEIADRMILSAPPKLGKTWMYLQLAICCALGLKWMGFFPCQKIPVLYINPEVKSNNFRERIRKICQAMGVDPYKDLHNLHIMNLRGQRYLNVEGKRVQLTLEDLAAPIIARVKKYGIRLVIIDPIYKVMRGSENDLEEVGYFLDILEEIAEAGCAVAFSHHHSKAGQSMYSHAMDWSSGTNAWSRTPEVILSVAPISEEISRKVVLHELERIALENDLFFHPYAEIRKIEDDFRYIPEARFWIRQLKEGARAFRLYESIREHPSTSMERYIFSDFPLHRLVEIPTANTNAAEQESSKEKREIETIRALTKAIQKCEEEKEYPTAENIRKYYVSPVTGETISRNKVRAALKKYPDFFKDYGKRGKSSLWRVIDEKDKENEKLF